MDHTTKLRMVADLLGGTIADDDVYESFVRIALLKGEILVEFNQYGVPSGMYHVSPKWPRIPGEPYFMPSDCWTEAERTARRTYTINISQGKTPERIAAEIEKRFIPRYLDMCVRIEERLQVQAAYTRGRAAMLEAIAALLPGATVSGGRVWAGGPYEVTDVSDKSLTVTLRSIPLELFAAVSALVGESA